MHEKLYHLFFFLSSVWTFLLAAGIFSLCAVNDYTYGIHIQRL